MARRYYNGTVRNLNISIESFPNNLVAGVLAFQELPFFELEDRSQAGSPTIAFQAPKP
jgi:LemA protein